MMAPGKFWSFLLHQVQKGLMSFDALMACATSCHAESCAGSMSNAGGKSIYGFTGTSPPASRVFTIFVICILSLATLFPACKKPCNLKPKDGYTIVGDDHNCYYKLIDESSNLDPKIKNTEDLKSKLEQIKKEVIDGKTVKLKMMGQLAVTEEQFEILQEFGAILKSFAGKISVEWNGNNVCPAQAGILLTHSEWTEWNKLPLGSGGAGAKGSIKFEVGGNEIELFIKDGQDGGELIKGTPVVDISTHADLHGAPQLIVDLYQQYQNTPVVKFRKKLELDNGADMTALQAMLLWPELTGKFTWHNGQTKQLFATDSVAVANATVLHLMDKYKLLGSNTFNGRKYPFILKVGPNSLDSVPNTLQAVRIPQSNSNNLKWPKAMPNRIDIVDDWNVGTGIPQQVYTGWGNNIKLVAAEKPELPGGRQNVCGVNDQFLDYLSEPAGDAKAGVPFKFTADQDLILAEYYKGILPPVGPRSLNISRIDFGGGNSSGPKLEASWLIATDLSDPNLFADVTRNGDIPLNTQTDKDEYYVGTGNDREIILGSEWLMLQVMRACGASSKMSRPYILPRCKLYLNDANMLWWWDYFEEDGTGVEGFYINFGFDSTKVDIIRELPPGKTYYGEYGQVNNGNGGKSKLGGAPAGYAGYLGRKKK
jgi:hypothetical protein